MKTASKYIVTAALAIMTLTGCSNEDNEPNVAGRKDYPEFSATIGAQSRAFDQTWDNGDAIGITGAGRTNVCYVTNDNNGNGAFTVKVDGGQIYFQDENVVTFTAYYPYNDAIPEGTTTISADTKVQSGQKAFDFLWAQGPGSKNAPDVVLNFTHRMAKVVLNIKPGDGMSYDEVKKARLSLNGFCHTGTFDIKDGTTKVDEKTGEWVFTDAKYEAIPTLSDAQELVTYSFIVFPQVFKAPIEFKSELALAGDNEYNLSAKIDFTSANGKTDADPKNEWVAGRQYSLTLSLHKTDIKVEKQTIESWTEVIGDDINVE